VRRPNFNEGRHVVNDWHASINVKARGWMGGGFGLLPFCFISEKGLLCGL
jgi:hypothetical protein